jgi:hypothetical protein
MLDRWDKSKARGFEQHKTYCLLSAARSLVCNHVHCDPEVAHWEQVGSFPSHLIFFRLLKERSWVMGIG